MTGADLVVVGGGIAGAAVALSARELGADVLLLERERVGGRATAASAGMLAAQYEAAGPGPLFRLAVLGRARQAAFLDRLEQLCGRRIPRAFEGMLVANRDEREHRLALEQAGWQREAGLRAEVVGGEEAIRIQPGLASDLRSWLWLPREGHVDTQSLAGALGPALEASGARVDEGCEVVGVSAESGRVDGVRLAGADRVSARRVVIAAGAWSDGIGGLPGALPVRPVRGQMLRLSAEGPALERPVATRGGRYLVPRPDGTLLAGSTMEDAGFSVATTREGLAAIRREVSGLARGVASAEALDRWAGLRPVTDDGLPILGPDPDLEGLHYATGFGRDGILLAPAAGRTVAELALEGRSDGEWEPFGAVRLGERAGAGSDV